MIKTILVVDDKSSVRILLRDYLTEKGYRVTTAENGRMALFAARHDKPDLILLDIMMPEMDGYQFIHAFRKEAQTPIILLTAKLEEKDKVLGLELGADDYITKPYGLSELLARVRAVLRRSEKQMEPVEVLRAGGVALDQGSRTVTVQNRPVELTPTEFDLLATLMAAPGRAFNRTALLDAVQGVMFDGLERTVNVHIRNLRTKIENDPANPRLIETVYGVGYRFTAE
ncbi:MAG: response regulator transcription factor [Anaerolineae bacterium]